MSQQHLTHSLAVYQTIRDRIIALEADIGEATLADTLEGLTDIHEVLAAIVRSALLDEALAEGLKGHIQLLQGRLQRLTERGAERRRIARDAIRCAWVPRSTCLRTGSISFPSCTRAAGSHRAWCSATRSKSIWRSPARALGATFKMRGDGLIDLPTPLKILYQAGYE